MGRLAHDDLARSGERGQPRGDVRREPGGRVRPARARAALDLRGAERRHPGVDPDVHRERLEARGQLASELAGAPLDGQRRLDRVHRGELSEWSATWNSHDTEFRPEGVRLEELWNESAPPVVIPLDEFRAAVAAWREALATNRGA